MFYKLRKDVKKAANFDLKELNIQKSVAGMDPSKVVIFIAATEDSLINISHSEGLYETFRGSEKRIWKVKGNHNSRRPDETYEKIFEYIKGVIAKREAMGQEGVLGVKAT